jgi:hypothetical protein
MYFEAGGDIKEPKNMDSCYQKKEKKSKETDPLWNSKKEQSPTSTLILAL